jgi:hypothetical protein
LKNRRLRFINLEDRKAHDARADAVADGRCASSFAAQAARGLLALVPLGKRDEAE